MPRGPSAFRKADVTRAVKALQKAGIEVVRVEIEGGKITITAGKPGEPNGNAVNEWDEVLPDGKTAEIH